MLCLRFLFIDTVSLYSPGCFKIRTVDEASLKLAMISSFSSSSVLRLLVHITIPSLYLSYFYYAGIFPFLCLFLFMCVSVMLVCTYAHGCPETRRRCQILGTGVTGSCKPPRRCREPNSGIRTASAHWVLVAHTFNPRARERGVVLWELRKRRYGIWYWHVACSSLEKLETNGVVVWRRQMERNTLGRSSVEETAGDCVCG